MRFARLRAQRWYYAHRGVDEPMRALVSSKLPTDKTPFDKAEFVALDIETTGLDVATAHMLSIGWVIVGGGRVQLETAESYIVRPSKGVGDSASVHGLTDTIVRAGVEWGVVLDKVVSVMRGRILVVHHAGLDKALLDRMCLKRYGVRFPAPFIDTLELELRRRRRKHHLESASSLRLSDLRGEYGLPRYLAHDCLVDAIATAELLIAMARHRRATRLGDVLG